MYELNKRISSGWVLMDSFTQEDGNVLYFLERAKCRCVIEIKPSGYGYVHSSSGDKRI